MSLRQAAQQALEALVTCCAEEWRTLNNFGMKQVYDEKKVNAAIAALHAALAEPEQGPVAVVKYMETGGNAGIATRIVEIDDPLRERLRAGTLLYTAPTTRKPLTDLEIEALWQNTSPYYDHQDFARAIEAAIRSRT